MGLKLDSERRSALTRDVVEAKHDVVALAAAHGLTPDQLAAWGREPTTRRMLADLCALADAQTQLQISRYRLMIAERLVRFSTEPDPGAGPEHTRKACVDVLRLELKRVAFPEADDPADDEPIDTAALRAMFYGESADDGRGKREE